MQGRLTDYVRCHTLKLVAGGPIEGHSVESLREVFLGGKHHQVSTLRVDGAREDKTAQPFTGVRFEHLGEVFAHHLGRHVVKVFSIILRGRNADCMDKPVDEQRTFPPAFMFEIETRR